MTRPGLLQRLRAAWFRQQWSCQTVEGTPQLAAPALLADTGSIHFDAGVTLGWQSGQGCLSGYTYIEARNRGSLVAFGTGTHLNNCVTAVSDGPGVTIGERCVVGPGGHIYDSDSHALDATIRLVAAHAMEAIRIADDVFIGSSAIVLKSVAVGAGNVIGRERWSPPMCLRSRPSATIQRRS
jgi:hypothetical protein